ncbi:hypothetical protein [Methylobacterium sp. UNC300MFChir4.1]|uniref:hypothetical protein n=1 Tax=Methylobacterium sp. UNC300MFChir4.1 TaxID=1502747 RepID=UPI000A4447AA|nr:hypothetical protein [Methylobacterium sp. UNC300MFChir4.1]
MPTILDPYRDHLEARWQAGCRNAAELARGLIRAGADIHPRVVRDWAMKRRRARTDVVDVTPGSMSAPRWRPPSIDRTAWLLQADPSKIVADDHGFLDRLRVEAPDQAKSVAVATLFADEVRRRFRARQGRVTRCDHDALVDESGGGADRQAEDA